MTATGIVLAGGRSSRFGSSKLDADLEGRTVLDRTIDAVAEAVDEVVVVGRPGSHLRARFAVERRRDQGPLGGIERGLELATTDQAIVVGGDMPLVVPALLRRMVAELVTGPGVRAAALDVAGWTSPLPLAVNVAAARAVVATLLEPRPTSLRRLLGELQARSIAESQWRLLDPDGDSLLDVDLPADLERVRQRLRSQAGS